MRKNIIYFIGFIVLSAFNSWMDYVQEGTLNLKENVFQALFITFFIRGGFWFEKRVKKKEEQENNEVGNR